MVVIEYRSVRQVGEANPTKVTVLERSLEKTMWCGQFPGALEFVLSERSIVYLICIDSEPKHSLVLLLSDDSDSAQIHLVDQQYDMSERAHHRRNQKKTQREPRKLCRWDGWYWTVLCAVTDLFVSVPAVRRSTFDDDKATRVFEVLRQDVAKHTELEPILQ